MCVKWHPQSRQSRQALAEAIAWCKDSPDGRGVFWKSLGENGRNSSIVAIPTYYGPGWRWAQESEHDDVRIGPKEQYNLNDPRGIHAFTTSRPAEQLSMRLLMPVLIHWKDLMAADVGQVAARRVYIPTAWWRLSKRIGTYATHDAWEHVFDFTTTRKWRNTPKGRKR